MDTGGSSNTQCTEKLLTPSRVIVYNTPGLDHVFSLYTKWSITMAQSFSNMVSQSRSGLQIKARICASLGTASFGNEFFFYKNRLLIPYVTSEKFERTI